jgi:hypothetical protein
MNYFFAKGRESKLTGGRALRPAHIEITFPICADFQRQSANYHQLSSIGLTIGEPWIL